jgi:hypothetical protein
MHLTAVERQSSKFLFSDLFAVLVLVLFPSLMLFFVLVLIPVVLLAGCPYDGEALRVRWLHRLW